MTRLFDTRKEPSKSAAGGELSDRARALIEEAELDQATKQLGDALGPQRGVEAIRYERERRGKWQIEHAQVGQDYVFQLFPLKGIRYDWRDVVTLFIRAMDEIFPRSVNITYKPPSGTFEIKFFTIRVKDVVPLPGWENARERALNALFAINAW